MAKPTHGLVTGLADDWTPTRCCLQVDSVALRGGGVAAFEGLNDEFSCRF